MPTPPTNILSRYGGQAGPTGATHAPNSNTAPVSLANFIGGTAAGPRLGKLQGDGRSAPPEAEAFLNEHTSPTRRGIALPGMASQPLDNATTNNKPLAAFLAARANATVSSPTTSTPPTPSPFAPGPASPAKEQVPPSAFARALANANANANANAAAAAHDSSTSPLPQQTTGGGTPISAATVSIVRRPSQTRGPPPSSSSSTPSIVPPTVSPSKRSWTANDAAPAASASPSASFTAPTNPNPNPNPTPTTTHHQPSGNLINDRASALAASTDPSSDKLPTASLTRLHAKGMVGQRIREAQVRQQSGSGSELDRPGGSASSSSSSPSLSSAPQQGQQQQQQHQQQGGGVGLAALRERWAHAGSTPPSPSLPSGPSAAGFGAGGPVRLSPTKERAAMFNNSPMSSPQSGAQSNPWQPGRSANALPGLASNFSNNNTGGNLRNRSDPVPVLPAEESGNRSPVRLPGLGGPSTPARLLSSDSATSAARSDAAPAPVGEAGASSANSVQVLKSLTASRPRGPAGTRKSRGAAAPATASASASAATKSKKEVEVKDEESVAIPAFQTPSASSQPRDEAGKEEEEEEREREEVPPALARNPLPRPPSPDKAAYASVPQVQAQAQAQAQTQEVVQEGKVNIMAASAAPAVEKAVQKPDPPKGRRSTVGKRILVLISGS
ncbi:unnamed protein product, partial [Tilletia laevis]